MVWYFAGLSLERVQDQYFGKKLCHSLFLERFILETILNNLFLLQFYHIDCKNFVSII